MIASVFRSSADRVWTADRLALSAEGNAEGLDSDTVVWGIVSANRRLEMNSLVAW